MIQRQNSYHAKHKSKRYNWQPLPKPWFWLFTFWKPKWLSYGHFVEAKGKDYAKAQFEVPIGQKFFKSHGKYYFAQPNP